LEGEVNIRFESKNQFKVEFWESVKLKAFEEPGQWLSVGGSPNGVFPSRRDVFEKAFTIF